MNKRVFFLFCLFVASMLQAAEVWEPKAGTGPETSRWRRLVVYGDQWSRHGGMANHGGQLSLWRNGYNAHVGETKPGDYHYIDTDFYDADGDGDTTDGYTASLLFSETERLGMGEWPSVGIYPTPSNWRFVGGVTWNISDSSVGDSIFAREQGMNVDHSGIYPESAEDHPLQAQTDSGNPASRTKVYWAMVWNKEDFLNSGDKGPVSLGSNARLATLCDRYWVGVDEVRFIIKDSGQYYIHDKVFTFKDGEPPTHYFLLNPLDTLWAPYNPDAHDIRFETDQEFSIQAESFKNIEAVGVYIAKDTPRPGMLHTKWYNFEFDGMVTKASRPSEHIEMVEVPGASGVQDFYMSNCEVPYKLWQDIYKYGDSVSWATEGRYLFNKDGDMGSMQFGSKAHSSSEPAVNFTLYDMVAWCNSLSEKEGLSPVFYADASHTQVFRYTNIATRANVSYGTRNSENPTYTIVPDQPVYVKWDAEGYRPPTPAEWERAYVAGQQSDSAEHTWLASNSKEQTQPVGTKKPNALGLYDMVGNVWELTWTHGNVYKPEASNFSLALGGGFQYPNDPRFAENSASPYGDRPYNGRHDIGLRLVRRNPGLAKPALGDIPTEDNALETAGIHKWKFSDNYQTAAATPLPATDNILEMASIPAATQEKPFYQKKGSKWTELQIHAFEMSAYEISYEKWLKVYFWGIENGYVFDTDGCMGSMRWWDFEHVPTEPVTAIPWHDMVVWCNALSAMEGLDPVYYTDDTRMTEYKKAMKFRGIKMDMEHQKKGTGYIDKEPREPWIFANWANNGYRLPTYSEWKYAARGGFDKKPFQWGDDKTKYAEYAWGMMNSGQTTHPVGQLTPNSYGLYDMQGNVFETIWGGEKGNHPTRSNDEDLNNPKGCRYGGWKQSKEVFAPRFWPYCIGGSFFWETTAVLGEGDDSHWLLQNHNASDVGFRVVKCETGTHPVDGHEELIVKVLLDYDTSEFDPLQGRCSQGNLFRNGQYPEKGVVSGAKIKWTADLGGAVKSSPVSVDGTVYVGGPAGLYALDATTGDTRWVFKVSGGVESSVCVVDGVVYFGGLDKKMHAVTTEGTEKWSAWSYQGSGPEWYRKPVYTPVAVAYDTVFAVVGHAIKGFSTKDGTLTYDPSLAYHFNRAAIAMNENYIFWGHESAKGAQRGELRTGKHAYGGTGGGSYCRSSAVVHGDMFYQAYAGGNFEGGDADYAAYKAVNIKDMSYKYKQYTESTLDKMKRTGCFSGPAIWQDRLLIGVDSGRLESYALEDGTVQANSFMADEAIRSPITVSTVDNVAYFGSWDDNVYCIDAKTLKKKWSIKTGGNVDSAVCIDDGKLYFASEDGKIYCIEGDVE